MRREVFFYTWAWAAIVDSDDAAHQIATEFYEAYLKSGLKPVTTNYILAETLSLLRGRIHHQAVLQFVEIVFRRIASKDIVYERIDSEREKKALELLKKYHDKPEISFFDLTSFVVMRELNIQNAFTGDEHFDHVDKDIQRLFHLVKRQWKLKKVQKWN